MSTPKAANPRSRTPVSIWIGIGVLCLTLVVRWSLEEIDHQYANIATAALLATGLLAITVGVLRRLPRVATILYAFFAVAAIALFIGCFEFRGFTGELVPTFRWRFQPTLIVETQRDDAERLAAVERLQPWTSQARFTQFLGNGRNGVLLEPSLALNWGARKPEVLWRVPMGDGWAGITVADGKVWTLFQDESEEAVGCYELASGRELWRTGFAGRHSEPMGGIGPRSTPTWKDGKIWIQTAVGIAACLDANTGAIQWQKDLLQEGFPDQASSEQAIKWGRSGSPLLVQAPGQLLVVYPLGGELGSERAGSLIAIDAFSGDLQWTSGGYQIAYGSPMLMTLSGVEQIVAIHEGNAAGHAIETGEVLWSSPWASHSNADACSSSPVACAPDHILLGKGYAAGSKLIRVRRIESDGKEVWSAEDVWMNHRVLKTKLTNAIYHNKRLFALSDGILECVDPDNGKRIWRGGRYGQGQMYVVNDRLIVTSEDGRLIVVESEQGKEIHSLDVLDGVNWNYPAVAGPFVLMRNGSEMVCLFSPAGESSSVGSVQP